MESETQIRAEHKARRMAMTAEKVNECSTQICLSLENLQHIQQAEHFYFYYPCQNEVDLLPLADKLLQLGKKVAFPRVKGDQMEFYEVDSLSDFSEGNFHIMEPRGNQSVNWSDAVVLVPGLVFDAVGNRLGYGKGYYDRYFHTHAVGYRIGVAYMHQMEQALNPKEWDVAMDLVITE